MAINVAYSAVFSFEAEPDANTAVLPAGTIFKAIAQNTISSKINKVGDPVALLLSSDITVGKSVCIPKDSVLAGQVVELKQATEGRNGYFRIALSELIFPDGWRTVVTARIMDNAATDIIGGGNTPRTEFTKVPHYIEDIGPVVKLVKSGPRDMGKERALPAGKEVLIVLDRYLEVKYLEKY